jgi:NADH-quinone oxidoreductase subunit L
MNAPLILVLSASVALLSPVALLAFVLVASLLPLRDQERAIGSATFAAIMAGFIASAGIAVSMVVSGRSEWLFDLGDWISIEEESFHFHTTFVFDWLSLPFLLLVYLLCGTVSAFATKYLHREPGYQRYFILYTVFTLGMVVGTTAGSIELLFFGWELVGLSSALLVGFFHERQAPVINGMRIWCVYRVADACFLLAAIVLHHLIGTGDFGLVTGDATWPSSETVLQSHHAFAVGLLLLVAAAGKSALFPFSGWLPRAMEGPTASSAIFYGALSVHLGAYLLLRASSLIAAAPALAAIIVALGLLTAVFSSLVSRVQSDIKSALAFASLTQVGLIVAEIGMGWQVLALIHIFGHAFLRTLQLLRAPNLLNDYFRMETAMGRRVASDELSGLFRRSPGLRDRVYYFAISRGHVDSMLDGIVVAPITGMFRAFTRWESAWMALWDSHSEGDGSREPPDEESTIGNNGAAKRIQESTPQ